MYQTYQKIFQTYLEICRQNRKSDKKDLEEKCKRCLQFKDELHGMLVLLLQTDMINQETYEQECEQIIYCFSTIELFRAYLPYGDVFSY